MIERVRENISYVYKHIYDQHGCDNRSAQFSQ